MLNNLVVMLCCVCHLLIYQILWACRLQFPYTSNNPYIWDLRAFKIPGFHEFLQSLKAGVTDNL